MNQKRLEKKTLISCYRDALNYFDEEGRCDICNLDGVSVKEIVTTDEDDAIVTDTWYCFKCYKQMMGKTDDIKKSFRPEWVMDCMKKPNKWINVKDCGIK